MIEMIKFGHLHGVADERHSSYALPKRINIHFPVKSIQLTACSLCTDYRLPVAWQDETIVRCKYRLTGSDVLVSAVFEQ